MLFRKNNTEKRDVKQEIKFFISDTVQGQIKKNTYIVPGASKTGEEVISGDFQSCIGVLAILKNGQYALYHARSLTTNARTYLTFIDQVNEHGVHNIFVFKKDRHNEERLKIYAEKIADYAACKDVHVIPVNDYQFIAADATKHTITFAISQIDANFISDSNKTKLHYSNKHALSIEGFEMGLNQHHRPI